MSLSVRGIQFEPDGGVVIEYQDLSADVKANGAVRQHAIALPPDTLAAAELERLEDAAERALKAALAGFEVLEAPEMDDVPGYDNPAEREHWR